MANDLLVQKVKTWIYEAGKLVQELEKNQLQVTTKSSRNDVVTNVDKEVQRFLVAKIESEFPEDKILAEEDEKSSLVDMSGRVWLIDPIDGTLNFVFQRENFAIMIGVYEDGIGKLGFIYDVMRGEMYWGGADLGVFCNEEKLEPPKNSGAKDGLWGINIGMYVQNVGNIQTIGENAMGVRMIGSAGLEFISLLKGNTIGYISNLYPWDYAPGVVLIKEFGFKASDLDGLTLAFNGQQHFIAATAQAYNEIMEIC
ncbi:MAG: inositol monophosphatase family protein [Lactobacillales bacterium]|jgi:myo-inositol-1(or 4)-monophosphatase|nr:inositol monophosphatase family protein [Lactobacillales bacterium]